MKNPLYSTNYSNSLGLLNDISNEVGFDKKFDSVVQLASRICNMPISLLSLLEINKQWFKSKAGLNIFETAQNISSFVNLVEEDCELFEIKDTSKDHRFKQTALFKQQPHIRFCAGSALVAMNGQKLGTLCVADYKPNHLTEEQLFALKVLSNQVISIIELNSGNERLKQENIALKQDVKMHKLMLSIIAHDVRNPLGAVKGVMDFINTNDVAEEDRVRLTQMFGDQLNITLDLLDNLVDWSKSTMYKKNTAKENVWLKEVADGLIQHFKLSLLLKNNTIINLVDADVVLKIDINIIRFVLRNLIANANKFTENGTITLYAHQENNKVIISVSDTGIGMNAETLKKLFHTSTIESTPGTNKEKGSGLGLMLTKDFIDSVGGEIEAVSEIGKGTTIYLSFLK